MTVLSFKDTEAYSNLCNEALNKYTLGAIGKVITKYENHQRRIKEERDYIKERENIASTEINKAYQHLPFVLGGDGKEMIISGRKARHQDFFSLRKTIQLHEKYYNKLEHYLKKARARQVKLRHETEDRRKEYFVVRQGEKIHCECGCILSRSNMSKHKKTPKHKQAMEQLVDS